MLVTGIVLGVVAYVLWTATRFGFRVEEGWAGVLTSFGAPVYEDEARKRLRLFGPGLHFKWPWQRVHRVPRMEQIIELTGEGGGIVMAEDGTTMRVDSILRYVPAESELKRLLFDMEEPRAHIGELFACLLRNEVANVRAAEGGPQAADAPGGSLALVRRERKRINADIKAFSQRQIGDVYGVQFNAVDLVDILPPPELDEALNAVMSAQMDAEALYARTAADCQRRIIAAKRGVEVARARATAAEREIVGISEALGSLEAQGTLEHYVARRRSEVLSQSKIHYVRSPGRNGAQRGA